MSEVKEWRIPARIPAIIITQPFLCPRGWARCQRAYLLRWWPVFISWLLGSLTQPCLFPVTLNHKAQIQLMLTYLLRYRTKSTRTHLHPTHLLTGTKLHFLNYIKKDKIQFYQLQPDYMAQLWDNTSAVACVNYNHLKSLNWYPLPLKPTNQAFCAMGMGKLCNYTRVNWLCSKTRFLITSARLKLSFNIRPEWTC